VTGSSALAKLLSILIIGMVSGSAGNEAPPLTEAAMAGPAGHRGFDARPAGVWEATGVDVETEGPGTASRRVLAERQWRFVTRCGEGRCRTIFLRTTPGGVERTVLYPHHDGYFTATFGPTPQPCQGVPGKPGSYVAHFRLHWSRHGRLSAYERGISGGRCTHGLSWLHWTATASPPSDGSSEASDQVL
jgi:hypothetical protein